MTPRSGPRAGGRPPKPPGEKAKRQTFALTPDTLLLIKQGASRLDVSQAKLIDLAIRAYMDAHP